MISQQPFPIMAEGNVCSKWEAACCWPPNLYNDQGCGWKVFVLLDWQHLRAEEWLKSVTCTMLSMNSRVCFFEQRLGSPVFVQNNTRSAVSIPSFHPFLSSMLRADVCLLACRPQVLDAGFSKLGVKQQSQIWLQVCTSGQGPPGGGVLFDQV